MDEETRRVTALEMALRFNARFDIDCPGCLMALAAHMDEFLRTGSAPEVGHLGDVEKEDNVVRFPPTNDGLPN